ncbi:hypothetical protein [Stutzerimonas nitrititolerans]|uniref:hypothetical protein n=1 Tax=Stutzerimonas nitrititolerans TaxID=2482751 RepID=UPI0028AB4BC6|nr:hypothetical protein [Stutzerimonas nitrititolerans]
MKIYVSLFLAAASMPVGFLAGVFGLQHRIARSFPDAMMLGAVVTGWALIIALVIFLWSVPSTMKRIKAVTNSN